MSDLNKYDGAIRSLSRQKISILYPRKNNYRISDIARGLAYKGHFAGQTPFYFSIAQHCLIVDELYCKSEIDIGNVPNPLLRLVALLHDSTEAYLGDMPKPYKILMCDFKYFENKMMEAMFEAFNIPILAMVKIKPFDKMAQELEYANFYNGLITFKYMSPDVSLSAFIVRYWEIINLIIEEKVKL